MTIVDSHLHLNLNGLTTQKLIKYLDKEKIDVCWLLSWEEVSPGPWPYRHLSVEDIYEAYSKYPSRIIPFYAPDPRRKDAANVLETWYHNGIRGCGELKSILSWDSEQLNRLLQMVRKYKMPVVFHMEDRENRYTQLDKILFGGKGATQDILTMRPSVFRKMTENSAFLRKRLKSSYIFPGYLDDLAKLEATLKKHSDINFIAHGLAFWRYISADADACNGFLPRGPVIGQGKIWRLLRNYSNLYADISAMSGLNALTRDSNNARQFLTIFQDKILYGTDNVMKGQKKFLNSLGLPKATYRKIYGENACSLVSK
jgi:predicted TIM-barrel fold metal-dependent hydrolase